MGFLTSFPPMVTLRLISRITEVSTFPGLLTLHAANARVARSAALAGLFSAFSIFNTFFMRAFTASVSIFKIIGYLNYLPADDTVQIFPTACGQTRCGIGLNTSLCGCWPGGLGCCPAPGRGFFWPAWACW